MKNKFHAISMCSLMAAFATSSWAASNCPTGDGWSEVNGVCYYDIQDGEQIPTIPSSLKSFKLRYKGDVDIAHAIVNLDNPDGKHYTYSVSGTADLKNGGLLTIKNRLNLSPYVSMLNPSTQDEMSSCNSKYCDIAKETGFNAVTVEFKEGVQKNGQSFELTVSQELFDFTSLEVYHTKGVKQDQVNTLVSAAQAAVMLGIISAEDLAKVPINKIKEAIDAGYESVALLHGNGENDKLTSIPSDIPVDYVYLDRTFTTNDNGDARSTIAFPFDISPDNIDGAWEILQFTRIGKDANGNDAVFMKKVYCYEGPDGDKCPAKNGTLKAYKPYIVQLLSADWTDDGEPATSLTFNGPVTLKATPTESGYADFADPNSFWVFRGVFEKIAWNDEAPDNVYGYAAEGDYKGQFVKAGKGAYILPFRGFLIYLSPLKIAPANSSYALRPNVLPDEMKIVIEGDNNETTVIGKFNTRTGEMNFINNMKHTYDLKGRRVNGTNNARGAYYGKKVLMK